MATQNEALDVKRRARRRLVGAIALVLFLVIVPPLVMDLEPKPVTTTLQVEIPDQKDSQLLPPPPAPAPQPEPPAVSVPVPEPTKAVTSPSPDPVSVRPAPTETKAVPPMPNAQEGYIIVMATLSKKDNVKTLQAKLKQAGFKSYAETLKTAGGEQTRVRAGPFATKDAADKARVKLQQLGLNPGPVTAR